MDPLKTCGVVANAFKKIEIEFVNIRDFATGKYKSVDDYPYGGGPGMIMRADVLENALLQGVRSDNRLIVNLGPKGKIWCDQELSKLFDLLKVKDLIFICGRYEGIDQRFIDKYVDYEISLGDFILSGGEVALLPILDSLFRFIPGVLGNSESLMEESTANLLEAPKYTRPKIWQNLEVPSVLLSGNHKKIIEFNEKEALKLTENKK